MGGRGGKSTEGVRRKNVKSGDVRAYGMVHRWERKCVTEKKERKKRGIQVRSCKHQMERRGRRKGGMGNEGEQEKISTEATREDSGNRGTKDNGRAGGRTWRELREGDAIRGGRRGEKLELRELNGDGCETSSGTEARSRNCE